MLARDLEQQELSFIAGGDANNGRVTLEDGLAISHKAKHTLTMQSSSHTPWYLPKGAGNRLTQKSAHKCL